MATATLTHTYRPGSTQKVYTVAAYTDIALNSATFQPGDYVEVLTTRDIYLFVSPETIVKLGRTDGSPLFKGGTLVMRDNVGKADADTATSLAIPGTPFWVHGQGIAETDAGLVVTSLVADGPVGNLHTTNETAHLAAIGFDPALAAIWAPATSGPMHIEAVVAMETAITDRDFFIGFIGANTAALDPVVTGATTTLTLVLDDVHGLFMDTGLTDADRLFAAHNKANAAASIATTADNVDTSTDMPAAGTYIKLRVSIDVAGNMTCYANDALISTVPASATAATALSPVLYVGANAAAIKSMLVKTVSAWSEA